MQIRNLLKALRLNMTLKKIKSIERMLGRLHLTNNDVNNFSRKYKLGPILGQGGNASVYQGTRLSDGVLVAVKMIPKKNIQHMDGKVPLEVALLQQLDDIPGVLHILEYFDMGDSFSLILENNGHYKDLFDIILEKGHLNEEFSRSIFSQVLNAVIGCYHKGIIHRDIKDENIVVDTETMEAKLIDFGSGTKLTNTVYSSFEGTNVYAPPEWLEKKQYKGEEMTVWELGILLYDMVCGNVPFLEDSQIMEGKLVWPTDDQISDQLKDLVSRCLCHDPGERIGLMEIMDHVWLKKKLL